jgi:hypothetical protein
LNERTHTRTRKRAGTLFSEWPLTTPKEVLAAVSTGYWKRCSKFRDAVEAAFKPLSKLSGKVIAPEDAPVRLYVEQLREAIQLKSSVVNLPLEAITTAIRLSDMPGRNAAELTGLRDAVAVMVSLVLINELPFRSLEHCMVLICLLADHSPTSSHWDLLKKPLLERLQEKGAPNSVSLPHPLPSQQPHRPSPLSPAFPCRIH